MMRLFRPNPLILWIIVITLIATLLLAFSASWWPLEHLRGGAGWRWPYSVPDMPLRLLPGIIVLVAYLGLGEWWSAHPGRQPKQALYFLVYCALGGLIAQWAFLWSSGDPLYHLFTRTVSSLSSGFFEVGVQVTDIPAFLRDYPRLMPGWVAHPAAHPPGIPLLYWGTSKLSETVPGLSNAIAMTLRPMQCHHRILMSLSDAQISAALLGMLLPVAGVCAVFPVYRLAADLYGDQAACRAALWLPVFPAFLMFTPQWNQLYVLLMAGGLATLHYALNRLSYPHFLVTGLLLSAATFLSFTNINLVGSLAVYAVAYAVLIGRFEWSAGQWQAVFAGAALIVLGLLAFWLIYYLVSGHTVVTILRTALQVHYGFEKPYLPWLAYFLVDVAWFSGLVLFLLAAVAGGRAILQIATNPTEAHPEAVLPIALLVSLLGLDLTGGVRGEVGRLLIGMMPLVIIVAAGLVSRLAASGWEAWAIHGALGIQVVVMVAFLRVVGTELAPPPQPVYQAGNTTITYTTDAVFGQSARLIGFDAIPNPPSQSLDLTLYWQALQPIDKPAFVSLIVVGPGGQPLANQNWLPVDDGAYPTSCWRPDEIVADTQRIRLSAMPPGDYWLSISMFPYPAGENVEVTKPGNPADTQVGVGPVSVPHTQASSGAAGLSQTPWLRPDVLAVYPHDDQAYTQGLLLHQGNFYESTGRYGSSDIREVDPRTGTVIRKQEIGETYFGEGLALVEDRLIQLTWREEVAFVYDRDGFEPVGTLAYQGEGWGLCYDGQYLAMSDGSGVITFRDAATFTAVRQLSVLLDDTPVSRLNELECVGDDIYANVYQTDMIYRIDSASGIVTAVIDASGLLQAEQVPEDPGGVLNGIAYDPEQDVFFLTGKLWPLLFEVRFVAVE